MPNWMQARLHSVYSVSLSIAWPIGHSHNGTRLSRPTSRLASSRPGRKESDYALLLIIRCGGLSGLTPQRFCRRKQSVGITASS